MWAWIDYQRAQEKTPDAEESKYWMNMCQAEEYVSFCVGSKLKMFFLMKQTYVHTSPKYHSPAHMNVKIVINTFLKEQDHVIHKKRYK